MQLMIMHKQSDATSTKPSPELIQRMGALMGQYLKDGRMVDGAGLHPAHARTRIVAKNGKLEVTSSLVAGDNELPAATMVLKVEKREVAEGWAERYAKALGDGEVQLGKVTEPWDLGVVPEPPNAPLQFLLIEKASAASEKNERSAQQKAELTRLRTEMTKAGVLQRTVLLKASANATRLRFDKNEMRKFDGPFTESKELIGGFAVIEFPNYDDAIEMSKVYADILGGTLEIDIREVEEIVR